MAQVYQEHKKIKILEDEQENITKQKMLRRALYELRKLYLKEVNMYDQIDPLLATMHMTLFVGCLNKGFMPEFMSLENMDDLESAENLLQDAEGTLSKLIDLHGARLNEVYGRINFLHDELLKIDGELSHICRQIDNENAFINKTPENVDDSLLVKPKYPEGGEGFFSRAMRNISYEWSKLTWNANMNKRKIY